MSFKINVFVFFLILFNTSILFANLVEEYDLHNQNYSPYRNQYFFKLNPTVDSQFCHGMALANLVGQALKISISPDDIVYQSSTMDIYNEGTGDLPFGSELPGFLEDDWNILNKVGFCPQKYINSFLNKKDQATYSATQDLYTFGVSQNNWKVSDMAKFLNETCKDRINASDFILNKYTKSKLETLSEEEKSVYFQEKIDQAMSMKLYVALLYQGHYVTIVGRTKDQKYLVQDSISKSEWISHDNFKNRQNEFKTNGGAIEFIDEHLQVWPKASLIYYADEIDIITKK